MPKIIFIHPSDQPSGKFRMIDWLESNFYSDSYSHFRCLVAFAKVKPFYKLHRAITAWNSNGKDSEIICGIDHKGTSYQALQYIIANFSSSKILHVNYSTFHPKLYIFWGEEEAILYYGSSNFTTGGLETNFEGGIIAKYNFPQDRTSFKEAYKSYFSISSSSLNCISDLTDSLLNSLNESGLLLDETNPPKRARGVQQKQQDNADSSTPVSPSASSNELFGQFIVKPARSIPKDLIVEAATSAGIVLTPISKKNKTGQTTKGTTTKKVASTPDSNPATTTSDNTIVIPLIVDGFVIQVSPHHNGEIFLSKTAIKQNPAFFGYPFSGHTVPKKTNNPSYPQRDPDPIVNIRVFDNSGSLVNTVESYNLNTVYYAQKAEIRITITPSILSGLNIADKAMDYPILVMKNSTAEGCDYDLDFYAAGSQFYDNYLSICDQTLPSGGKSTPRKMGWI